MDINSILCIGRHELMERVRSYDVSRKKSSGQRHRHEVRPSSVVDIYSPFGVEKHGIRYRTEKERKDVVISKLPDNRHGTHSNRPQSHDHRSLGSMNIDAVRARSARERFSSNVTDINYLLCRGYKNFHDNYDDRAYLGSDRYRGKKDESHIYSRPVRILSSRRDRIAHQQVPKVKYVTEIVRPCSVIVSARKQETARAENDVQDSVPHSPCILRSKSVPPGNGSKTGKRVSFGPKSIFGESTA